MRPNTHILLATPPTIILYYFFKEYALIFLLASFIFDIDHYLDHLIHEKNLSPFKAYKNCIYYVNYAKKYNKLPCKDRLHIFHTIETYLLILILAFYNKIFLFILIGLTYHLLLDAIYIIILNPILKKSRAVSLIMWIKRRIYSPSKLTNEKTL